MIDAHPGVSALTALAFGLILGRADRFQCGEQLASYVGVVPLEGSRRTQFLVGTVGLETHVLLRGR